MERKLQIWISALNKAFDYVEELKPNEVLIQMSDHWETIVDSLRKDFIDELEGDSGKKIPGTSNESIVRAGIRECRGLFGIGDKATYDKLKAAQGENSGEGAE